MYSSRERSPRFTAAGKQLACHRGLVLEKSFKIYFFWEKSRFWPAPGCGKKATLWHLATYMIVPLSDLESGFY